MKKLFLLLMPLVLLVGCADTSDLEARLAALEAENTALKERTSVAVAAPTRKTIPLATPFTTLTPLDNRKSQDTVKEVAIKCNIGHGAGLQTWSLDSLDTTAGRQCKMHDALFTVIVETSKGALYTVTVKACEVWRKSCQYPSEPLISWRQFIPVRGDTWPPN